MVKREFDRNSDEHHEIDTDKVEIESVSYKGSKKFVETKEMEEEEFTCPRCGDKFKTEQAKNGHMASCDEVDSE